MLKVSKLPGVPGGSPYSVRFPEGLCPVPFGGVVTEGPLPEHIMKDPWLKFETEWDDTPPGVLAVLATIESEKVERELRGKASTEAAKKVVEGRSHSSGETPRMMQLRSNLVHLRVRAKGAARKKGKGPEDWKDFVDPETWNKLADELAVDHKAAAEAAAADAATEAPRKKRSKKKTEKKRTKKA